MRRNEVVSKQELPSSSSRGGAGTSSDAQRASCCCATSPFWTPCAAERGPEAPAARSGAPQRPRRGRRRLPVRRARRFSFGLGRRDQARLPEARQRVSQSPVEWIETRALVLFSRRKGREREIRGGGRRSEHEKASSFRWCLFFSFRFRKTRPLISFPLFFHSPQLNSTQLQKTDTTPTSAAPRPAS